jgi:PAS domain S-box-containing protein
VWFRAAAGQLLASGAMVAIVYYVMEHGRKAMAAQFRSEQALRDSEDRARLLIEHAPEAIVVLDVESQRFVVANPTAEALFGYSLSELLTKSPADVSPERQPDGRSSKEAAMAYVMAAIQGIPTTFEWLHRDAQGRDLPCEVRLLRLPDPDRVLVRGSLLDVTERKQMEAALKESMALLRATLSAAPVGIARIQNRTLLEVSEPFARMLGYRPEELIGQSSRMLYANDEMHQAMAISNIMPGLQTERTTEIQFVAKDGHIIDVAANVVRVDEHSWEAGVIVAVMDMTERNQLQNQLRQSQKLEAIGTLAGGIAHDFNNILAGILGFTALAQQQDSSSDEVHTYLHHIDRAAKRAAALVTQILSFSRTSSPTQAPLQMKTVVDEVVSLLRATLPASIHLELQVPERLPVVQGNASQLHQVLMNLGTNAAQAMNYQSGTVRFHLAKRDVDDTQARLLDIDAGAYVQLTVADTGCGMDAATLERAFEPFFTTKTRDKGTGLGLSVVHGIIRSHKGAIHLISEVGTGTTVEVLLPTIAAEPLSNEPSSVLIQHGHGERILFVDDEEQLVLLGERMLRRTGYKVEGAQNVVQALTRLESEPDHFQLVVTDQTMPAMTGLQFAARIRKLRPNLPVVLATGNLTALAAEEAQRVGVAEILPKPYSLAELAAVVHRHLPR